MPEACFQCDNKTLRLLLFVRSSAIPSFQYDNKTLRPIAAMKR